MFIFTLNSLRSKQDLGVAPSPGTGRAGAGWDAGQGYPAPGSRSRPRDPNSGRSCRWWVETGRAKGPLSGGFGGQGKPRNIKAGVRGVFCLSAARKRETKGREPRGEGAGTRVCSPSPRGDGAGGFCVCPPLKVTPSRSSVGSGIASPGDAHPARAAGPAGTSRLCPPAPGTAGVNSPP